MRTVLLVCGLLLVVVGLGVLIGVTALPSPPAKGISSSASSVEPEPAEENAIPAVEPKARLHLPGVAVVDLPRLIAAHPRTIFQDEILAEKVSHAQSLSSTQAVALGAKIAEVERSESLRLVVNDIRRIIKAYAATNHLKLVLDRSASLLTNRPVVEYSSNAVEFHDITGASGVRDITPTILQIMASERPNNDPHRIRR
jgi:hypothetical protein